MAKRIDLTQAPYLTNYDERATFHEASHFVDEGDVGDISLISTDVFDVSRIPLSRVGVVIGSGSRSLTDLCVDSNVNEHALFRPDGNSPYRLGDFGAYNHEAEPNTYWTSKIFYAEKEYGLATTVSGVSLEYGEKCPQKSDGVSYHQRKDFSDGDLLSVQAKLDGDDIGSEVMYEKGNFPIALNIAIPEDYNSSGLIPLECLYRTRTTTAHAWSDSNEIEDGSASLNLTVWTVQWALDNVIQTPTNADMLFLETRSVNLSFTFDIVNGDDRVVERDVYWAIYQDDLSIRRASGVLSDITIPAYGTVSDSISATQVTIDKNSRLIFSLHNYWDEPNTYSIGNWDIPVINPAP